MEQKHSRNARSRTVYDTDYSDSTEMLRKAAQFDNAPLHTNTSLEQDLPPCTKGIEALQEFATECAFEGLILESASEIVRA